MATLTGVSTKTVRRYLDLSDPTEPSLGFMVAACTEYGLSLDHIVNSAGKFVETDSVVASCWTANLQEEKKDQLMVWTETVWEKALEQGESNPNLLKEQNLSVAQFGVTDNVYPEAPTKKPARKKAAPRKKK